MRRSATAKPEYILSTLNCGDIVLTSKSRKIHWPLNVVPRQAILTSKETIPLDNNSVFKLGFAWKKKNRQHSQDELVIHSLPINFSILYNVYRDYLTQGHFSWSDPWKSVNTVIKSKLSPGNDTVPLHFQEVPSELNKEPTFSQLEQIYLLQKRDKQQLTQLNTQNFRIGV